MDWKGAGNPFRVKAFFVGMGFVLRTIDRYFGEQIVFVTLG